MKITVVGAGKYGSTTVQRIAEKGIADEVVMTDIVEGLPQGLALDMMQSRSIERFETRVVGTNTYAETAGSGICVVWADKRMPPTIVPTTAPAADHTPNRFTAASLRRSSSSPVLLCARPAAPGTRRR